MATDYPLDVAATSDVSVGSDCLPVPAVSTALPMAADYSLDVAATSDVSVGSDCLPVATVTSVPAVSTTALPMATDHPLDVAATSAVSVGSDCLPLAAVKSVPAVSTAALQMATDHPLDMPATSADKPMANHNSTPRYGLRFPRSSSGAGNSGGGSGSSGSSTNSVAPRKKQNTHQIFEIDCIINRKSVKNVKMVRTFLCFNVVCVLHCNCFVLVFGKMGQQRRVMGT
jgi:hypothetical protein